MICGSARLSIFSVLFFPIFVMRGFDKSKNLKVLLLSHLTFREVRQT